LPRNFLISRWFLAATPRHNYNNNKQQRLCSTFTEKVPNSEKVPNTPAHTLSSIGTNGALFGAVSLSGAAFYWRKVLKAAIASRKGRNRNIFCRFVCVRI
jgi:hypothetical protein